MGSTDSCICCINTYLCIYSTNSKVPQAECALNPLQFVATTTVLELSSKLWDFALLQEGSDGWLGDLGRGGEGREGEGRGGEGRGGEGRGREERRMEERRRDLT